MKEKEDWLNLGISHSAKWLNQLTEEQREWIFGNAKDFASLMMQYRCAIREIETKLNVLNDEFSVQHERNPFEAIKSRVKEPLSILQKLKRRGYECSIESIEKNLNDVAGIRVICSFVEDIYYLADVLTSQDDLQVLEVKDYIENPKPNGYRSLHLIIQIPIFLSNEKKNMRVEVQFRTIAMDFWASLDHKLKYKKNVSNPEVIANELKKCADVISGVDQRMQEIRNLIEVEVKTEER